MEVRLVLFLALASSVLIANALALLFVYRALANMTTTVTQTLREFENDPATRSWLKTLEDASNRAVSATDIVKKQLVEFEPVLARAQSSFGFGLAKLDIEFERLCKSVDVQSQNIQSAITEPVERLGEAGAGIQALLAFTQLVASPESGGDANPTRKK